MEGTVATTLSTENIRNGEVVIAKWSLVDGETGDPFELADFSDCSVQVAGSFGAGGVIAIEGTIDDANYATLSDPVGNSLSFSSAGLKSIAEVVRAKRPRVVSGTSVAVNICIIARRKK